MAFADIAEKSGVSENMIRRLLRHAMTMRVFQEPEPGMVAHTAASKLLSIPFMNDWLRTGTDELWPSAVKVRSKTLGGSRVAHSEARTYTDDGHVL